jgi:hypothetical protein
VFQFELSCVRDQREEKHPRAVAQNVPTLTPFTTTSNVFSSAVFGFLSPLSTKAGPLTLFHNITATMSFSQTQHMQIHFTQDAYKAPLDNLVDPNATPFAPNARHQSYVLNTSVRP